MVFPGGFFPASCWLSVALSGSICANILISLGLLEAIYAPNIVVIAMVIIHVFCTLPITGTVLIMEMTASLSANADLGYCLHVGICYCRNFP